jgi:hypothetical protein
MSKRLPLIAAFALAIALTACSSAPTTTPSPTARPFPTLPPATDLPSESASGTPVAVLPSDTPVPPGCAFTPQDATVFSDRLTGASVTQDVDKDLFSLHFATPSASRPQGDARLTVGLTEPPFFKGASTDTYTLHGNRYLLLRFTGMTIIDPAGKDIYSGPTNFKPTPAIALVEGQLTDASEGTIAFVVGYDSLPCPTLSVTNTQIDLVLPH